MPGVALFTDEPALAKGFVSTLSGVPEFDVVAVYETVAELVAAVPVKRPDVLLLDLKPQLDLDILKGLQNVPIVLWVRSISPELAREAMELGIRGILRKTVPVEVLIRCLKNTSAGELWFDQALAASLLQTKMVSLTKRESGLVTLLSKGLTNREIAGALTLSEGTVKVYLSRLYQKVGAKDRHELALYGLRILKGIDGGGPVAAPLTGPDTASRAPLTVRLMRSRP